MQQVLLAVLTACALAQQTPGAVEPVFPPPPRLAITAEELARIREARGFEATKAAAVQAAEPLVAHPVPLPKGSASWVFYYACPEDGTTLRPLNLDEHKCPRCARVYTDERTVASYRCLQHYEIEHASVKLGWAYAYTGDDRYAAQVKRILLYLADAYRTYPERLDRWGNKGVMARLGGRRYVQSLDEAVGVIRLAKGYDLTRSSLVWTDAEKGHVEGDFFRPTADTLLVFNQGINNHQTWYNGGLMAISSVLGDAQLVDKVLTMRGGFFDQLERSVGADGLWYEGTVAYHNYALQAMVEIADAGRRMGLPLHEAPKFRSLIEGPLKAAYPNGQFPAINDSDLAHVGAFDGAFLWAWKAYGDPFFAQAWARGDAGRLRNLLGEDAVPAWPMGEGSTVLPDAGLVKLQVGRGPDAVCVFLDYGPHGGGHGHFDKLNIVLYAAGREWLLDPGRLTYSHKEYKTWVKHTAAHNTVTINGRSQSATTGKLLWYDAEDAYAACAAEADGAYADAVLRRYVLLTPQLLVDVFEVEADSKSQVDWFAHALSQRVEPADERGEGRDLAPGQDDGYQHLAEARVWTVERDSRWDFVDNGGKRLRLWFPGPGPQTVFVASGIGYWTHQKVPCLVRRRQADRTRFVTVYDLSGDGSYVRRVSAAEDALSVQVETVDGVWLARFGPEGVLWRPALQPAD